MPRRHRHSGLYCLRRSIPRLYAPLSTLRRHPRGYLRMTIAVRAEPSVPVTAAKSSLTVEHQLRWFDQSRRSRALREPMRNTVLERHQCQDALRVAVVACTSAIHPLLAFIIGHDTAHNFLLKRRCCRFAQDIEITSDPRITFPYLLKIRASTLELCALLVPERRRHHSLEAPINPLARRSIPPHQRPRPRQTLVEPASP